jgi:ubiquinone/menaquinone biosynthesis C-methylase UbiE
MVTLERKIGGGSFVGYKKPKAPQEIVEYFKHFYAYKYASRFAENKLVLDVGCGVGYGADELSNTAYLVIGTDIWKQGIRYAHNKYSRSHFLVASALNLPFRDSCFDVVTSFQVIEHIEEENAIRYLQEIKRVLKYGGIFIVTTPNRKLRLLPFQKPWNPDHKKEYDARELERILKIVFKNPKVFGLLATEKAYLIEYYRVKQSPLSVYIFNPLLRLMKKFVPSFWLEMMKKLWLANTSKSKMNASNDVKQISTQDFKLTSKYLNSCLDLYGICRK